MRRLMAPLLLASLGACAQSRPTFLADGRPAYLVTCTDPSASYDRCFRRAGEICGPDGYRLYDWQGYPLPATRAGRAMTASRSVLDGSAERAILVGCRG